MQKRFILTIVIWASIINLSYADCQDDFLPGGQIEFGSDDSEECYAEFVVIDSDMTFMYALGPDCTSETMDGALLAKIRTSDSSIEKSLRMPDYERYGIPKSMGLGE